MISLQLRRVPSNSSEGCFLSSRVPSECPRTFTSPSSPRFLLRHPNPCPCRQVASNNLINEAHLDPNRSVACKKGFVAKISIKCMPQVRNPETHICHLARNIANQCLLFNDSTTGWLMNYYIHTKPWRCMVMERGCLSSIPKIFRFLNHPISIHSLMFRSDVVMSVAAVIFLSEP